MTPAPQIGDRFANRYELRTPLRSDEVVRAFLAFDHHAGRDVTLLLFDSGSVHPNTWNAFARVVANAASAGVAGLVLPQGLSDPAPVPPYCLAEVQVARGFDRLREQGPLPWERAFTLGERVAEILHKVHAATGVAHRALTLARCAVTIREDVKVFDYGVAELIQDQSPETGYGAPEQQAGAGDARSDVYALGVILFELVAGRRPSGSGPHNLRKLVPVPRPVDDLLARALARDPAQRFADLAALRSVLREHLGLGAAPPSEPVVAEPPAGAAAPTIVPVIDRPLGPAPPDAGPARNAPAATSLPRIGSGAKPPSALLGTPVRPPLTGSVPRSSPSPTAAMPPQRAPLSSPSPPADRTEVLLPSAFASPMAGDSADRTEVLGDAFSQAVAWVPAAARARSLQSNSPASADNIERPTEILRPKEHVLPDTTEVFDRARRSPPVSADRTDVLGPAVPRLHDPSADRTEVLTPSNRELFPPETAALVRHAGGAVSPPATPRTPTHDTERNLARDPPTERFSVPPSACDTTLDLGPRPTEDASNMRMPPVGTPAPDLAFGSPPDADADATTQWFRPLRPVVTPRSAAPTPAPSPPPAPPPPPVSTPLPEAKLKRTLILINLACLTAVVLGLIVMALTS